MDYSKPRSVSRLEQELEELERKAGLIPQKEEEEVEEDVEQVEELETTPVKQVSQEEETFKKRYSDLRRHSQKQEETLTAKVRELEQLVRQKEAPALPSEEEAKAWALANPKAAAIIRALANEQVSYSAPKTEDVVKVQKQLDKMKQESLVRKSHQDFDEIVSDDNFHKWAEVQPKSVQDLIYGTEADEIIWALNLYKTSKKKDADPAKEAARIVTKTKSGEPVDKTKMSFSESQVQKMSLQEFEKFEEDIQKSMKNGTFLYDLSGGAR